MISSYQVEAMVDDLNDDECVKIMYSSEGESIVDKKDTIIHPIMPLGEREDDSVLIIIRESGRKVLINLDKVDLVCVTLKRYI